MVKSMATLSQWLETHTIFNVLGNMTIAELGVPTYPFYIALAFLHSLGLGYHDCLSRLASGLNNWEVCGA